MSRSWQDAYTELFGNEQNDINQAPDRYGEGNIDLLNRPRVVNEDKSISTVRSKSFNLDGKEVLLPTIDESGRNLSDEEAVNLYKKTGKNLGIFNSPEEATKYAVQLHNDQEKLVNKDIPDSWKASWDRTNQPSSPSVQPEETTSQNLVRGTARTATRALELPIDVISQIKQLVEPKLSSSEREAFNKNLDKLSFTDYPINVPQEKTLIERTRAAEKELTGEYLQPQTPGEENWDEFVTDAASNILLAGKEARAFGKITQGIVSAATGQAAKAYAKYSGGGEAAQDVTKNSAQVLASLYNPGGAIRKANELYSKADSLIPETAVYDARILEHEMNKLQAKMARGTLAPSEKAIYDESRLILDKIKNGQMKIPEAIASKRSINEKASSWISNPDKAAVARARTFYKKINKDLSSFIKKAERAYPEGVQAQMAADEIYGAVFQSKRVGNFLSNLIKKHPTEATLSAIFGLDKKKVAGIAAISPLYKGYQIAQRMMRSPQLQKYYFRALRQAAAQNGPALLKTLNEMREVAEEDPSLMKFLKQEKIREEYAGSPA